MRIAITRRRIVLAVVALVAALAIPATFAITGATGSDKLPEIPMSALDGAQTPARFNLRMDVPFRGFFRLNVDGQYQGRKDDALQEVAVRPGSHQLKVRPRGGEWITADFTVDVDALDPSAFPAASGSVPPSVSASPSAGPSGGAPGGPAAAPGDGPHFGTLMTEAGHAKQEAAAGLDTAMIELNWRSYEPAEGQFNADYVKRMKATFDALRNAGMRVTLGIGMHYAPQWAFAYPDSRYVNQRGAASTKLNLVFNNTLRQKADAYLTRIDRDFGLENFASIRLTSGGLAEVLYPNDGYWGFDRNAQNGANLPPTMPRNPAPGWRPGDRSISQAQVRAWADWYIAALDDVLGWQQVSISRLGFGGRFEILTPGVGVRPGQYDKAVAEYLPDGLLGVGAAWPQLYRGLKDKRNVVAYISSVADGSGKDAPCQASDRSVALTDPAANGWSATRWITRIADEYGLGRAGENPGYGLPASQNARYVDNGPNGMLAGAFRLTASCKLSTFYWAHDFRLFDGTAKFADYAARIAELRRTGTA